MLAVVVFGVIALFGLGVALLLGRQRGVAWAGAGAAGALAALAGLLFAGPRVEPVPVGVELSGLRVGPDFGREWAENRVLYGDPIGSCLVRDGLLTCPTKYYYIEWHPENPAGWRFLGANLGLELMARRGIPEEPNPTLPPALVAYLADQQGRGVDLLRFFGRPRTGPIPDGDRLLVYFDRAVFVLPAESQDPAAVGRLPLGEVFWALENRGLDPTSPPAWTLGRLILAGLGLGLPAAALLGHYFWREGNADL